MGSSKRADLMHYPLKEVSEQSCQAAGIKELEVLKESRSHV
jgi:hypothetical protein